jgi:hypothetical protein
MDDTNVVAWLESSIPQHFLALRKRPEWLQNPEWPFADGKPMIFVGQIDLPKADAPNVFHDDTSLYVFVGAKTRPEVVIQQL